MVELSRSGRLWEALSGPWWVWVMTGDGVWRLGLVEHGVW